MKFPRQIIVAVLGIALLALGAYFAMSLFDTVLTQQDKVEAIRRMVDWALDDVPMPGWNEKNQLVKETRSAKDVAVVYRIYSKEPGYDKLFPLTKLERSIQPLEFKDKRVRVMEVPVEGGAVGGQAEVTLMLEGDGRTEEFNPTITIWTPSMKGEYQVVCRWKKQWGRLVVEARQEVLITGKGWERMGK